MTDLEQIKNLVENFIAEVPKIRQATENKTKAEIKAIEERFLEINNSKFDEIQAKQKEIEEKNSKIINSLEKMQTKPNTAEIVSKNYQEFIEYFNEKIKRSDKVELKSDPLALDAQTTGGYTTMGPYISNMIVQSLLEISPIMQNCYVVTIPTTEYIVTKVTGSSQILDVMERATATTGRTNTTSPDFAEIRIPLHEKWASPLVSNKMLFYSRLDVENFIKTSVSLYMDKAINTDALTGTGETQMIGLLSSVGEAANISNVNSGVADALPLNFDKYLDLWATPKFGYKNKQWYMNRSTFVSTLKYKDGVDMYMLPNNLSGAMPLSICGSPIIDTPDMPNVAANVYPIMYGDLKTAYHIVKGDKMWMQRDTYTVKGHTMFELGIFIGGAPVQPEAVARMKISA